MNIFEMYAEDQTQYSPIQEEIRSRYCQTTSLTDYDTHLDWNLC